MKKYILVLIIFLLSYSIAQEEKIIFKKEPVQKNIASCNKKLLLKIEKPQKNLEIKRPKLKDSKKS